jgi:H+/gluconate symporter-like permease
MIGGSWPAAGLARIWLSYLANDAYQKMRGSTLREETMSFLIALAALVFLMFVAYRGFSVILFAPVAAMGAVLLTDPGAVPAAFTGLFMDKMVGFAKLYFPVFLLGAVFGKVIELSGFSKSIVAAVIGLVGTERAMLAIVLVCGVLTYGGVSLFVVVFAAYPFAAEMFRAGKIPKRLIPGTIALGAFSFTMDSLPFSPQIQNIIPTTYFKTTNGAAPILGVVGAIFIFVLGMTYLEWRRRQAIISGEGYGEGHSNEPPPVDTTHLAPASIAFLPLVVVFVVNLALGGFPGVFTGLIDHAYGTGYDLTLAMDHAISTPIAGIKAIWAVEGALLAGILTVFAFAFPQLKKTFAEGSKAAVAGALLAAMNTASEYGFGGVIAALPGFIVIKDTLSSIPNPLVNEAITVTSLAGITGSASGGMSIALAAMAKDFLATAEAAHIPPEVLHRIASMASGGMDTLPHNGAVITLLAVTGLTHRQSYKDIFAVTCLKTLAVFFVIGVYYLTGLV